MVSFPCGKAGPMTLGYFRTNQNMSFGHHASNEPFTLIRLSGTETSEMLSSDILFSGIGRTGMERQEEKVGAHGNCFAHTSV